MQNEKPGKQNGFSFCILHSAFCIGLVAAVFHAAVLAAYVAAFHGDLSALVCVARERLGQTPYEHIHTGFDRNGYDGQFYYAIARAPWSRHDLGIDAPAIRQARILYPAVSWLLSAGDAHRLLWVMPLVNLLAIAALAALGAIVARGHGLSPWWGVLLPFAVNAGMPALRNLTDVLSTLTVAALLIAWLRRWPWWVLSLCAAAALFSREQNVVVVLLVFVFALTSPERQRRVSSPRRWRSGLVVQSPLIAGLLGALLLWSVWLCVLRILYGSWSLLPTGGNMGPPLAGMLYRWTHLTSESRSFAIFHLICMLTLTLQLGLSLWLLRTAGDRLIHLVALAGAGLAIMGGLALYGDNWSYTRVFAWLPLGVWLGCVQARWRWPLVALSAPCVLPLAVLVRVWLAPV
ncbi:MAG TPA: hypothetical protein VN688_10785 [Gemmataceae bacterium]|nr:hypothetical protein [Gemmataceae bacterium]